MPSLFFRSSFIVPSSMIVPLSRTIILSIFFKVDRRWAMAITVLFVIMFERAFSMANSESLSRAEVASSRIRIGVFFMIL